MSTVQSQPVGAWTNEAIVAASALRAAGIPTTLADYHFQSIYPHIEFGYCRPRILVPPALAEEARVILREARKREVPQPAFPCPECHGPTRRVRRILVMLVIAWHGTFFPFFSRRRRCPKCRKTWRATPVEPFTEAELGYDPWAT